MTDTPLKVAVAAIDIVRHNPAENLAAVGRVLATLPADTDLLVLPELFTTGYIASAEELRLHAETDHGSTIATLTTLAARHGIAIAGTFAASTAPHYFNRAFFIEPSGETTFYDKRHLFALGAEPELFAGGVSRPPVVRYRGWNIAMIVCYDLRFPVWSRRNAACDYDLLLVPAAWPASRAYAWEHLLIARAIENQAYVVGANRSGTDDFGSYSDTAQIYDPLGRPVGVSLARRATPAPVVTATLSIAEVCRTRERMPAAASADAFSLDL